MHDLVRGVTNAGLLHDIGKVLHRGSNADGRAHSVSGREWVNKYTDDQLILDCIRYHHHQDISSAKLENDSAAYIVYLADNIASGADRREIEGEAVGGFDRSWSDTIKTHTLDKNRVKEMLRKWQTNTQRNSNEKH